MHVHVITGEQSTGKTTRLEAIQKDLKNKGISTKIISGEGYTTPYFLRLLSDQAMAGASHFLADDCTPFQIRRVLELKALGIHSGIPSNFTVHLVRQA